MGAFHHPAYHRFMLRWFLLLTIALLPLRGWVGAAMSEGPLAHELGAGATVVAQAHAGPHTHPSSTGEAAGPDHDDCMGHSAVSPSSSEDAAGMDSGTFSCPSCSHCQACSAVALVSSSTLLTPASFDRLRPAAAVADFASADRAPGFKPPIS
jgi:hypothetical protein